LLDDAPHQTENELAVAKEAAADEEHCGSQAAGETLGATIGLAGEDTL
jgi:hypothetical protein